VASNSDLFQPIAQQAGDIQGIVRPSMTYFQDAWRRLRKSLMAMVGIVTIVVMVAAALVGPYLLPYSYTDMDLSRTNERPTADHWFGTDNLGRDLLARCLMGARISLLVGISAALMNLTIGVLYGGVSGMLGGAADTVMMRVVDIMYGIPVLLIVIMLMVVLEPGLKSIMVALGFTYWLGMARIVRGQILSLRETEYVLAARTLGAGNWRVLLRHLVPNAIGPIIVTTTLLIPGAIFTEAFLSFIGLGIKEPMASWGALAANGYQAIRSYPWQLFFPAALISVTLLAFNFLGDGLRDALDPRLRH